MNMLPDHDPFGAPGFVRDTLPIPTVRGSPVKRADAKRERDKFYSSARWMKFRRVYLFDNPLCLDCMWEGVPTPATTPHHIIERLHAPELAYDEDNLIPLCHACHTRRHKAGREADASHGGTDR